MTPLRTAAHEALEALEAIREADTAGATPKMVVEARKMYEPTITALKAALAEPVQEPVQEPALNPAPGYCKHCKQYTIEEPLPAEPVQGPDRAAFERHAKGLGYSVDPDTREGREGGYWSSHTHLMWQTWQAALAEPVQEPFGYFRAEPFGWTDCAATDEGATALYTAPPQSKPMPAWLHYCPASDILTIHGRAYSGAAFAAEAPSTALPQEQAR